MLKKIVILAFVITCLNHATSKQISLKVGQTIKIALPSNPTTGYSWDLSKPLNRNDSVSLEKTSFVPPQKGRVGQDGTHYWIFKGQKLGKTTISLDYRRPWETDTPPAQAKTYTFRVR